MLVEENGRGGTPSMNRWKTLHLHRFNYTFKTFKIHTEWSCSPPSDTSDKEISAVCGRRVLSLAESRQFSPISPLLELPTPPTPPWRRWIRALAPTVEPQDGNFPIKIPPTPQKPPKPPTRKNVPGALTRIRWHSRHSIP